MSEILLRLDPVSGKVNTVEVIADDEKSQTDGMERLQYYMKDIYEFSRKTVARARIYRMLNTTLSFSQEVACSADLQLHAPHWPEANKPHGKRLSHANREGGLCEDILVDKVVLIPSRKQTGSKRGKPTVSLAAWRA